jgi:septal ring factor EnvC (AmiA/AmiB activator)
VQQIEGKLTDAEGRIEALEGRMARIKVSLAGRRGVLVEVLATLQRMGRAPPPAVIVRPEDALASIRSAILMGAVLPELRGEAERLAADLSELVTLRDRATGERDTLKSDAVRLVEERRKLELLVEERKTRRVEEQKKLDEERRRSAALALKADGLKDLIEKLEAEVATAKLAADAARAADLARKTAPPPAATPPSGTGNAAIAALTDPNRMEPAMAFSNAKGRLKWPVRGAKLKGFGEPDGPTGSARGLTIATRAGARVTSPADAWVVYAGPFRSYGQMIILNAGDGYHLLLAGLEKIDVELGQFVLGGEPVGAMREATTDPAARGERAGGDQPALYVEFRKDGVTIDPTPWWATAEEPTRQGLLTVPTTRLASPSTLSRVARSQAIGPLANNSPVDISPVDRRARETHDRGKVFAKMASQIAAFATPMP